MYWGNLSVKKKRDYWNLSFFFRGDVQDFFSGGNFINPAHFKIYLISVIFLVCVKLSPLKT